MNKIKICGICGNNFISNSSRQKYCSKRCYLENKKRYKKGAKYKKWERIYSVNYRLTDAYKKSLKKFSKSRERKEYLRRYYSSDKGKECFRKYHNTIKGKENMRKHKRKRRAFKMNIIETFTQKEWLQMKEATKGICPCCNKYVGVYKLTLDHIYAVSLAYQDFLRTGIKRIYTIKDIQPLCHSCNSKKQDKLLYLL